MNWPFGIAVVTTIMAAYVAAIWYRRWSDLLESVRRYRTQREADWKQSSNPQTSLWAFLSPFDLHEIAKRDRTRAFDERTE